MTLFDGKFRFSVRSRALVVGLAFILLSAVLAVTFADRDLAVTANVHLQTPDGIEIYLDEGLTQIADSIEFGTLAVDSSGGVLQQSPIPVWIRNNDADTIQLTLEDDFPMANVVLQGNDQTPFMQPGQVLSAGLLLQFNNGSVGDFNFTIFVDSQPDPRFGGNIRMSTYADTRDWDPRGSSSLSSVNAYSQLYNQIVQFDTTDTSLVVCDLCTGWEITNAGQTFTFKFPDDIKWQDGQNLTAEDVVHSMHRYGDLNFGAGRSGLWRNYAQPANAGGVNLINGTTMEFNLQFPSSAFLKFLAIDYVKVLPKHILDQGLDLNLAETIINNKSGSGPFVLDEYQRGNFYKVSKNPNYFKSGRPFFNGIDHFIITDTSTLIAQFMAGQIDMSNGGFTNLSPVQSAQLEADTNGVVQAVAVSPSADWGLMMNIKKAPFSDPRIREAIQLAINYQQWNNLVFNNTSGTGCPLMGLAHTFEECAQWPGLRPKDGPGGAEDLAKAKQLMIDAGYPDGFQTRYDVRQVGTYPDQCAVIKQHLKDALGIDGDITTYPSAAGYTLFGTSRPPDQEGDWELACQGEGQVVLDVDGIMGGIYLKGAARNYTDWENAQVNAWHEQQKTETDPVKRIEIQKELELFLFSQQDNHWITLGWGILEWLISENIQGFNAPQTVQTHFKHEDLWFSP